MCLVIVREERKQKKKLLNVLTNRKSTPPPETSMIDLTPCKDNEKSNISSDANYSNSNNILPGMSEIQPITETEILDFTNNISKMMRRYFVEQKRQWNLPLPLETLKHWEMIHLCIFSIQGMKSWSIFCIF